MRITASAGPDQGGAVDLIGIIAFEEDVAQGHPPRLPPLDAALTARLTAAISEERFKAKPGKVLVLSLSESSGPRRLALVGAGPRAAASPADLRHPAAVLARLAGTVGATSLLVMPTEVPGVPPEPPAPAAALEAIAVGLALGNYRFDKYLAADRRTRLRSRLERDVELKHERADKLVKVDVDGAACPVPSEDPTSSDLLSTELDEFGRDRVYEAAALAAVTF